MAVTAAYQVTRPVAVRFESPWPVPVSSRGLYPVEDGFRWTSGPSTIRMAGPGPRTCGEGRRDPLRLAPARRAARPRFASSVGTASVVASTGTGAGRGQPDHRHRGLRARRGRGPPRIRHLRPRPRRSAHAGGARARVARLRRRRRVRTRTAPSRPAALGGGGGCAPVARGTALRASIHGRARRAAFVGAGVIAAGLALARGWTAWLLPGAGCRGSDAAGGRHAPAPARPRGDRGAGRRRAPPRPSRHGRWSPATGRAGHPRRGGDGRSPTGCSPSWSSRSAAVARRPSRKASAASIPWTASASGT